MDAIIYKEVWKPVVGFEGAYEVSNNGNVRSLDRFVSTRWGCKNHFVAGCLLRQELTNVGYKRVVLCGTKRERVSVHHIVARAFPEICGEWFDGCEVHHKDFKRSNNRTENLIVVSHEEHVKIHLGSAETQEKLRNNHKKMINRADLSKPIVQLTQDGSLVKRWNSICEAERSGIASKQNIMSVLKKRPGRQTAGGFRWIYESEYV